MERLPKRFVKRPRSLKPTEDCGPVGCHWQLRRTPSTIDKYKVLTGNLAYVRSRLRVAQVFEEKRKPR